MLMHRAVLLFVSAFVGTHCAYPRKDGRAEFLWVADYLPLWFTRPVTHLRTNRGSRRL